jgi:peroxiredoxin
LLLLAGLLAAGDVQAQLTLGDRAPEFTLPAATGDTILHAGIRLSDARAKGKVVLAFYPADWSGGCTKEMCTMRDNFADLASLNATVFGISGDYVFSHHEWAKHLGLPFALLSDHDHAVAKQYASFNADRGYNRRTVFVVGQDGLISYIDMDYKVSSPESFERLRAALR